MWRAWRDDFRCGCCENSERSVRKHRPLCPIRAAKPPEGAMTTVSSSDSPPASTPADGDPPRLIPYALYAVLHETEWHLAEWSTESGVDAVFHVVGNQMQSGDRWLPEWVDRYIFIAESA